MTFFLGLSPGAWAVFIVFFLFFGRVIYLWYSGKKFSFLSTPHYQPQQDTAPNTAPPRQVLSRIVKDTGQVLNRIVKNTGTAKPMGGGVALRDEC
jgi:hypothetical protein